jgi:hypothetical protein
MDYHFLFATGGQIPAGAQPNPHGKEANGDPLWVARSPGATDPFFFHGGIHPGKVRPGFGAASISFGENEEFVTDYEVLMEAGIWQRGPDPISGVTIPDGAVVCGREATGEPLFVARASLNGGLHPGKIRFGFSGAFISFAGKAVQVNDYEVLISPVVRGA